MEINGNERLDYAFWLNQLNSNEFDYYKDSLKRTFHGNLSGLDWVAFEKARQAFVDSRGLGECPKVPVDIFTWSLGTPPKPYMTKFGGAPFRPRELPVPIVEGEPGSFLCQFNFNNSHDIVPNLPGEVLVIFTDHCFSDFAFEWYAAKTGEFNVASIYDAEIYNQWRPHETVFGQVHRSFDYVFDRTFDEPTVKHLFSPFIKIGGDVDHWYPYHSSRVENGVEKPIYADRWLEDVLPGKIFLSIREFRSTRKDLWPLNNIIGTTTPWLPFRMPMGDRSPIIFFSIDGDTVHGLATQVF